MTRIRKDIKSNQGITMVEVIFTTLIFVLLSGAIFLALNTANASWHVNDARIELSQELRKAMVWMQEDIRQSGTMGIVGGPVAADGTWYNSITYQKSNGINAGSIQWSNNYQFALAGAGGNEIHRYFDTDDKIIAHNIQSLQIRRQAATADIVEVILTAQKNTATGQSIIESISFNTKLRN